MVPPALGQFEFVELSPVNFFFLTGFDKLILYHKTMHGRLRREYTGDWQNDKRVITPIRTSYLCGGAHICDFYHSVPGRQLAPVSFSLSLPVLLLVFVASGLEGIYHNECSPSSGLFLMKLPLNLLFYQAAFCAFSASLTKSHCYFSVTEWKRHDVLQKRRSV